MIYIQKGSANSQLVFYQAYQVVKYPNSYIIWWWSVNLWVSRWSFQLSSLFKWRSRSLVSCI